MKKDTRYMLIIVALLIVLFMMSRGYSYAKYASNSVWNYYLESKGFYFTSDDVNTGNVDNNWDGGRVSFSIKNYVNDELITDYNITYKATCTIKGEAASTSNCKINGSNSNIYNGTLSGGSKAVGNNYFEIESSSELTGLTVEIKVESLTPYKKTITGEYVLNKGSIEIGELKLTYNSFSNYESIVVTNSYNENKCVKLTWDSPKIRIDDNDNILSSNSDENGYINEIIFSLDKKDSLNFIFYKSSSSLSLSNNDFTLIESSDC